MVFSTRKISLAIGMLSGVLLLTNLASAQVEKAQLGAGYEAGLSPKLNYETVGRLLLTVAPEGGQLRVTAIDKNSPALSMKSPNNPNEEASLETGDFIRAVDGQPVSNVQALQKLLGAAEGEHRIEIVDHRTQQAFEWLIQPQLTKRPQMRASQALDRKRKAFVVIAGLTNDPDIGPGVDFSVEEIARTLQGDIDPEMIEILKLTGSECRCDTILETILTLPTTADDSLVVFFLGHGAFDPDFENDQSRGHFFDLPGGDLLRRVLWDHMQATPARARMLVTDTCNVESEAKPSQKYAAELRTTIRQQVGPTKWEWLLLGHKGVLDVGATSRNQRAWFSSDIGGWFSTSFIKACNASPNGQWPKVFQDLPNQTQQLFVKKRQEFLDNPGITRPEVIERLRQQDRMTPVVRNNLNRDQMPPVDASARRQMTQEVVVRVPINN